MKIFHIHAWFLFWRSLEQRWYYNGQLKIKERIVEPLLTVFKFWWINLSAESIVIKLGENESGLLCFKKWQNVLRETGDRAAIKGDIFAATKGDQICLCLCLCLCLERQETGRQGGDKRRHICGHQGRSNLKQLQKDDTKMIMGNILLYDHWRHFQDTELCLRLRILSKNVGEKQFYVGLFLQLCTAEDIMAT